MFLEKCSRQKNISELREGATLSLNEINEYRNQNEILKIYIV